MARTRKTITIDETPEELERQEAVEIEEDEAGEKMTVAERLAERMKEAGAECVSRIYREDTRNPQRVPIFLERVDFFVEEEYIAENYGGGRYVVRYQYKDRTGERKSTSLSFAISDNFGAKNAGAVSLAGQPQNNPISAFLGGLTAEKVAAGVALIEGVKKLLAPPPPPVDFTELVKALANRGPSVGDAVLIKALEGANRPQQVAAPSILTQIKEVEQVKELLGVSNNEEKGGDTMNAIVEQGIKLLPLLLMKNGGNYQAAGADVRGIPQINDLITNDPGLAKEFLDAVAANEKYGIEAAKQMAAGFGYTYEPAPEETQQITNDHGAAEPAPV